MTVQPAISPPRLRSVLFIPGNRPDMLSKAGRYAPDAYVPDMEDSVPEDEKSNARATIAEALPALLSHGRPLIPRVNSLGSGHLESDVRAVVGNGIAGISVGKISSAEAVIAIDRIILDAELESGGGSAPGSTFLLLWLETAGAIMGVREIVSASARIQWVAFGADDFTADMEMSRQRGPGQSSAVDEIGLIYPRSAVAIAARAAGIESLDTPYVGFKDEAGLIDEAVFARRLGFTGKCAIHPSQIGPIHDVFSPSADEIDYARRVLDAWEQATVRGSGATSLDGDLIDTPVVERARRLLAGVDQGISR